jgi:hypothetical protein
VVVVSRGALYLAARSFQSWIVLARKFVRHAVALLAGREGSTGHAKFGLVNLDFDAQVAFHHVFELIA